MMTSKSTESSEALILYQFDISPFCDKVRRVMDWKGLDYHCVDIPIAGTLGIRKHNSIGKVPVLEHTGQKIPDSSDIVRYLEKTFAHKSLLPEDPLERAHCHILEDWADESLYFYEMTLRFTTPGNAAVNVPRLLEHDHPLAQKILNPILRFGMGMIVNMQGTGRKPLSHLLQDVKQHTEALNSLLSGGDWLVGQNLSLADISVFVMLDCIMDAKESAEIIQSYPRILAWMARVDAQTQANPA
jgi:glutathione S-transferase